MSKKTPEEVLRSISEDLKARGITHVKAYKMLGYASVQSVSNLLSTARKNITYLSYVQASRYAMTFGYSEKYLMTGEGELLPEITYKLPEESLGTEGMLHDSAYEMSPWETKYRDLVMTTMEILSCSKSPYLSRIFDLYLRGQRDMVRQCIDLFRQINDLPLVPPADTFYRYPVEQQREMREILKTRAELYEKLRNILQIDIKLSTNMYGKAK